jgi:hypothetical protein
MFGKLFEKRIYVPLEAKIGNEEFNGVKSEESFYTAPYGNPLNHTVTHVFDGAAFGIEKKLLVRTGNLVIGLSPEVFAIQSAVEEGDCIKYTVKSVSRKEIKRVIEALSLG